MKERKRWLGHVKLDWSCHLALMLLASSMFLGGCRGQENLLSLECRAPKVVDVCGVCGGDNSTCLDCAGEPYGVKSLDECGVCGGDNTSCMDCAGVLDGGKQIDACGVCGGDNTYCADCGGTLFGAKEFDLCGVCGGDDSSCADCAGAPWGDKTADACGVCAGDNASCVDCAGTPWGNKTMDACGVCDGDSSSCQDCAGTIHGTKELDACGICAGDNTTCLDCAGVANGMSVVDCWGACGGLAAGCCQSHSDCDDENVCTSQTCNVHGQCELGVVEEICGDGIDNDCDPTTQCFVFAQGDFSTPLQPIAGDPNVTLGDFYDYTDWSAHTSFESSNRAAFFLFAEWQGDIGLVYILDKENDGSGGRHGIQYTGATDADLVVRDDPGDAEAWDIDMAAGTGTLSFKWNSCCTDGFGLNPLNAFGCIDFHVTENVGIDGLRVWVNEDEYVDLELQEDFSLCLSD